MSIVDALTSFDFTIIDRYSTYIQGLWGGGGRSPG